MEQQEAEIRLRELQEDLSDWKSLLELRAVKKWLELAEDQMTNRKQNIFLSPLESLDHTLAQEFRKGEISGIYLFSRIPEIQVSALEEDCKKYEEILGYEQERTDSGDDGDSGTGDFEPAV